MIQKSLNMVSSYCLFFILVITAVFFPGCNQTNKFTLGEGFVEPETNLKIIDTFRVDLSTILLDSLKTSGTGVALVGDHKGDEFGSVRCISYFEPGYQTFDNIDDNAVFDSAVIVLTYSGYYYGDTTSLMSISLHQLTEAIVPYDNGYLYNNSAFRFSQEALGSKLFYPEPNSPDTIITFPVNGLGKDLFGLIKSRDNISNSSELFLDYLKGFVITSDGGDNKAIIGFKTGTNYPLLRIFYHLNLVIPEETIHMISISIGNVNKQFNNIQCDFTNTALAKVKSNNNEISSSETGNKSFLQASVGLLPKIQFPTLGNILLENRWKVVKAELVFEPVKTSYDFFALPDQLYLYESDKYNGLNKILTDINSNAITANFTLDKLYNEDTRYTFDITSFISGDLLNGYFDVEHSLIICPAQLKLNTTLQRMVIECKDPPVKLKLYYLTY